MKKIYFLLLLFWIQGLALAQVSLPYAYNFDGANTLTEGWQSVIESPTSLTLQLTGVVPADYGASVYSTPNSWSFCTYAQTSGGYNQYLISPRFTNATADSVQLRFKYCTGIGDWQAEPFRIGYTSAASYSSPADFTWWTDTLYADSDSWQSLSVNLPADAQYVIIHYCPDGTYLGMFIDDILIRPNTIGLEHTIYVSANAGGTVTPSASVSEGDDYLLTVTADPGYYIQSVMLDGQELSAAAFQTSFSYLISPVLGDHTFSVTFIGIQYSIFVTVGQHGSVTPDGGPFSQVIVPWGHDTTFYFTGDPGYHVEDVVVDNYWHGGSISSYTFTNVVDNHTIRVTFAVDDYVITASAGVGGTISPSGEVGVAGLTNQSFTITPNQGYLIDTVYVDGTPASGVNPSGWTYTFYNVSAPHTISAVFVREQYEVTFSHSVGGTLIVTGGDSINETTRRVYYDDILEFSFLPDEGYQLSDVQVNGVSVGAQNPYQLTNVLQNTTLNADFEVLTYSVTVVKHGFGTVTPMSAVDSSYFATTSFTFTPSFCRQLDSLQLDGDLIQLNNPLEITHLVGNHQLDVYFGEVYYTMSAEPVDHGTITLPPPVVCSGNAVFGLKADPCYSIGHFYLDGVQHDEYLHYVSPDSMRAVVPDCRSTHTVSATFVQKTYTVNVTASGSGSISHQGSQQVLCGTDLSFAAVPDECSYVSMLLIDDEDVTESVEHRPCQQAGFGDTLLFSLTDITAAHTVQVFFATLTYDISKQVVGNGSFIPSGVSHVQCSGNLSVSIVPLPCNRIRGVWADGVEVTDQLVYVDEVATYTFSDVRADHLLLAEFETIPYQMSLQAGEHGRVVPSGDGIVLCNGEMQMTIVPDACYYVDTVWIDGVVSTDLMLHRPNASAQTGDSLLYTFSNITDNHTVDAHFAPITYPITTIAEGDGQITGEVVSGEAQCGDALTFTITPGDCYVISQISYNGETLTDYSLDEYGATTISVASLGEPVELIAKFERITFSIVETTPQHGSLTYPAGAVGCGENFTVEFIPDNCYHLDSAFVNGVWYLPSQLSFDHNVYYYVIQDLQTDAYVSAHFSIDSVHFAASGAVPVSVADTMLACGQPLTCYSVITDCQVLDSVVVNGTVMSEADFQNVGNMVWSGDTLFFSFGALTGDCNFSVYCTTIQYSVLSSVTGSGTVDWHSGTRVNCGDTIAIAIHPNDCNRLARIVNYGVDWDVDNDTLLIINNVHSDYKLEFIFEGIEYEATLVSNGGGTIIGNSLHLACGDNFKYEFVPDDCARLDSVWLDGQCVNPLLDTIDQHIVLKLNDIRSDFTLQAQFVVETYRVQRQVIENGVVVEDESTEVLCGTDTLLSALWPDDCYSVERVRYNGTDTVVLDAYSFNPIHQNILLQIEIIKNRYHIEVQSVANCEIASVSLTDDYVCGENATYTFTPAEGYYMQNIVVDGVQLPADDHYDLLNIHADHTISAVVAQYMYQLQCDVISGEGSVEPESATLPYGTDTVVRIHPAACYHIDSVFVNDVYVGSPSQYSFNDITGDSTLRVVFARDPFYVVAVQADGGSIVPADTTWLLCGDPLTYTITPAQGYYVSGLLIDGVTNAAANSYTFVNVNEYHTIEPVFTRYNYEITVNAGSGGSITPVTDVWVPWGEQQSFDITADACYHIDSVFVDGMYYGNIDHYTFNHVTTPHEISATFARNSETITASAGEGGTIMPTGAVQLLCGDSQTFAISPDDCHYIAEIRVNGTPVEISDTYTFENVVESQTIEVVFESLIKQIALNVVGDGGSLQPNADTAVTCGETLPVSITPAPCHIIQSVQVNGVEWTGFNPAGDVYTFSNIRGDSSLTATFAIAQDTVTVTALNAHGTVTSFGENVLDCGSDFSITITPDDCYAVGSVRVDGVIRNEWLQTVGDSKVLTLNDIVENHTISVNFNQLDYLMTAHTTPGGTISPMGAFPVCGSTMTFTVEPIDCYAVDSVFVNGVHLPDSEITFNGQIATFEVSDIREDLNIYVKFRGLHYQLNLTNNGDGQVTLSQGGVDCDGDLIFSILPSACERIEQVLLNGVDITTALTYHPNGVSWLPDTATYVISNVQSDQDLVINYQQVADKQIVVNYYDGTLLMAQDVMSVNCGSDTTLTFAYPCYSIDHLVVNGESASYSSVGDSAANYSLHNILLDYVMDATFLQKQYNIVVTASEGGSLTPAGTSEVLCGDSWNCTITPDEGWYIDYLTVDGEQQAAQNSWSFTSVQANHTLTATFAQYNYTVTTTAGTGGSVSPAGTTTVTYGESLTVTITPDECYHTDSVWVDGVFSGAIAEYTFSSITADHTLSATFVRDSYTITATAGEGGSISMEGISEVLCGDNWSCTITPDEGWYIDYLTVDGELQSAQGSWSFTGIQANHTLAATFAQYSYTITTTAGTGGNVSPVGATNATYGENLTVTITPDECYHTDSVFVDGVYSGAIAEYTFSGITADHDLSATFVRDSYTITATAGTGGSITPDGTSEVLCGDSWSCTITPEEGYYIDYLTVDGEQQAAQDNWSFTDVQANHTLTATFAQYGYTITATASEGGSVTPAGTTNVNYGESLTVTIVPDDCFAIASIMIDGEEIEELTDSYTFANVVADHTLDVVFEPIEYSISSAVYLDGEEVLTDLFGAICGDMTEVELPLFDCFHMDSLRVNGEWVEPVEFYVIDNVRMDYVVEAFISDDIFYIESFVQDNGTISPSDTMVFCTSDVFVTITPDDCYHVDSVFVDGVYSGAISDYLFSNIVENHTISATFVRDSYTITATAGGGGSISPVGTTDVLCGDNWNCTITPDEGYYIDYLTVDGEQQPAQDSWSFTEIHTHHTLTVTFAQYSYTVTTTASEGGSVSPAGTTNVTYGESLTVTIAPADCYHIDSVFVDGVFSGAIPEFTFDNITTDHTLSATFVRDSYTITATAGEGGSISPVGTTDVLCGDNWNCTITPDEGWYIDYLTVDGEQQPAQNSWSFTDVQTNHTLTATFAQYSYTITAAASEGGSVTPAGTTNVTYGENLTVTIAPADCYHIDSVLVDGVYSGSISEYTFSGITADHTLTATFVRDSYTITATAGEGGSISPAGPSEVLCGDSWNCTVTPDEGWYIDYLTVDGEQQAAQNSWSFTDVQANHTITASFAQYSYTVITTAGEGGSVSPAGTTNVTYGESLTVTIAPADCYHIDSVLVDGVYSGAISEYTFDNITADHTLTATFVRDSYTITATAGEGGSISPSGTSEVLCGDNWSCTITPDEGWYIDYLIVDGEQQTAQNSWSFTDVQVNHTLTATFAQYSYTVTTTAGEGGSVTPAGNTNVTYGESLTVTIAPADCYHIDSVLVDGVYSGAISEYTFDNITADHTLTATFVRDSYTITATAGEGGSISPSGTSEVLCGDNWSCTITPDEGWYIDYLIVDGEQQTAQNSWSFTDVQVNHTLTATFAQYSYTVTTTAGEGGSVTPAGTTNVTYGESLTVTIAPDECYQIDAVFIDSVFVGDDASYTFSNVTENHTMEVTFSSIEYTVGFRVYMDDEMVLSDTSWWYCGDSVEVEVPLFDCYHIDSLKVNGDWVEPTDLYTIASLDMDYEIEAYLYADRFYVATSSQGNGVVLPSDTLWASCEEDVTVTFVPETGWRVLDIIVDGENLGEPSDDSYTFIAISENHTIEVIFALRQYEITSSVDPINAGQITPYGTQTYNYGDSVTYYITPFPEYRIVRVEVDGEDVGAVDSYTFSFVDDNHTIVAYFETVGIDESSASPIVIRVADANLFVESGSQGQILAVEVFDLSGRCVMRHGAAGTMLQLPLQVATGTYVVRVITTETIENRKVSVMRR